MATPKIDLFSFPHKEQRTLFFELSSQLSRMDFKDKKAFSPLQCDLQALFSLLRDHADSEDTFISPLLQSKGLSEGELWENEHKTVDDLMSKFDALLNHIHEADSDAREELGVALYQTFNRFMAHYLLHLDREETHIMPLLWNQCRPEEIAGILVAFKAYKQPEEAKKIVPGILNEMTLPERDIMFDSIKKCSSPEAYAASMKLAEKVLNQK